MFPSDCPTSLLNICRSKIDPEGAAATASYGGGRRRTGAVQGWAPRARSGSGSGADRDSLFLQHLLQFARLEHLADDVAAADELPLDVELRDRRPVGECLDPLAHQRVGEHVDAFE